MTNREIYDALLWVVTPEEWQIVQTAFWLNEDRAVLVDMAQRYGIEVGELESEAVET